MKKIRFYFFSFIFLFLGLSSALAQPIGPATDIKPQVKQQKNPTNIDDLDLPYKPVDVEDDTNINESLDQYEDLHPGEDPNKPKKPEINWSQMPFVPSKTPTFKALEDPKL